MIAPFAQSFLHVQVHYKHTFTHILEKNLMDVTCKKSNMPCLIYADSNLFARPGCNRRFAVISNLRRHLRVHRPSHVRRRLTSQERRGYVERLIERSGESPFVHGDNIDEGHMNYNTFPSMCYSPSSSSTSSPRGSMSPTMESTTYRLLKPKETRPVCLTVQHLLN